MKEEGLNKKVLKIISLCFILEIILIIIGIIFDKLSFGLGLGDIGMLIILFVVLFIPLLFFKLFLGKSICYDAIYLIIILMINMYLLLHLTFLRGDEQLWDGNIFIN